MRLAPQAHFYGGPIGLLGEYVISRQEVRIGDAAAELETTSWMAVGSFLVTGENASYGRVKPRNPYDGKGQWGALEVVARVQRISLDEATFPTFAAPSTSARSAFAWALGLNWHVNANVKFSVNYENTSFGAVAGATSRSAEHVVLGQMQIAF